MKFKDFKELHDSWREWRKKKPRNKYLIGFYYPFILICVIAAKVAILCSISSLDRKSYRRSDKYKKVIKEGLFYDTIEYHEKEKTQP